MEQLALRVDADGLWGSDACFQSAIPPEELHRVLGRPDEFLAMGDPAPVGHRSNQLHLYHQLGIHLNEHHATGLIQEVQIHWTPSDLYPIKGAYEGVLRVEGTLFPVPKPKLSSAGWRLSLDAFYKRVGQLELACVFGNGGMQRFAVNLPDGD